jgi:stage II sporulation protein D
MPRPARSRRPAALAAAALVGGTLLAVSGSTPAQAAEQYGRPADGVYGVEGHGWGHGHGMSQWGAQGAATLGTSADTITSTYYPGTTRTVLPAAPIRVKISADEGTDTQVWPQAAVDGVPALSVTDAATGATAVLAQGPTRWRVTTDATGLHVSSLTGTTWTPFAVGAATTFAGPVRFSGPTFVRLALPGGTSRDYRGAVTAVRGSATALTTVVVLPLESYLLGVVPRESSSSWQPAALQAQAIAARSYSAYKRAHVVSTSTYDICDSTQCQVFGGSASYTVAGVRTGLEPASTTSAVQATAGVVRTYGGSPIFAEFSSSNGGWSTAGGSPYLVAQADPWDGVVANSVHAWTAQLSAADLERAFPALGTLTGIDVTARDGNGEWGGRVRTVVLHGTSSTGAATTVTTTGRGVYGARTWPASATGLRSTWWHLTAPVTTPSSASPLDDLYARVGAVALGTPVGPEQDLPGVAGARTRTFTLGRAYWSAATGAHWASAAILTKYLAVGGPAVLGLPTTDQAAVTGGAEQVFQLGRVYRSARTGTHWASAAILTKYLAVGGPAVLGLPTTDQAAVPGGAAQVFQLGRVYRSARTGTHWASAAILTKYLAVGGPAVLGLPTTDQVAVTGGAGQTFQLGRVYRSARTLTHWVHGPILTTYLSVGGPAALGLPTTDEFAVPGGRQSSFLRGRIVWTPSTGARVLP